MLPNKFFDFVQARLGMLISPATEVSALVEKYALGPKLSGHSVAELVSVLRTLTGESIRQYKQNAHAAAQELSSERDRETLRRLISALL
jgi:hypothetical protein